MLHTTRSFTRRPLASRWIAAAVALSLLGPLAGCSTPQNTYAGSPAPYNAPRPQNSNPISRMSTGQKLAVLAGAAALYYMYKKHQNAQGSGPTGQYYRSKNGGVYYRDQNGKPVWVQPPAGGIQVPASEAARYESEARQNGFRDTAPTGSPY
jgi:hypothetical protein